MNLQAKIIEAATLGLLTLAHVEDGKCFESVSEWLEYNPGEGEMEDALCAAKLMTRGCVDNEIFQNAARQRAHFASIKGA